jgi:hypothetical protein
MLPVDDVKSVPARVDKMDPNIPVVFEFFKIVQNLTGFVRSAFCKNILSPISFRL